MSRNKLLAWLAFWMAAVGSSLGSSHTFKTEANVMVEMTFTAKHSYADPFNQVLLDVVFIDPSGHELRVPAFWDGGNVWKARYASPLVGTHHFQTECSNVKDSGLNGVTGKVEIKPYKGNNPLYQHGPLQASANHRYLEHLDGTPFFWLGDTWWMGLSHRLHWPDEFQELTANRKAKGFNVIQIVAGLYPDMFPFDARGANEAGFPWETNYTAIRPAYFDAADQRLLYLVDQGFTPCIVGAWGYFMPWMGVKKMEADWRNLIARYGALPVVWCAAGEANLPWYLVKGFPYDDRNQVHDWTEVMRYIRATDPWHRPLTLHPTGLNELSSRHATDDASLLDFDMLQTPHGRLDAVAPTVNTVRHSYAAHPILPVIDGEASYEMLGDSLPTEWTRRMFWLCLMNGAAGHTYGANGIWQNNRPGDPHGKSPHGGTYGKIPWNEAMNLPGSQQVGFGKRFFEQFAWQDFRPHPQWARYSQCLLNASDWIWFPEGNPAVDAPAEKRFFRRIFVVPVGQDLTDAKLRVSVDDRFTARINGTKIGSGDYWASPRQFNEIAHLLKPGTNVLAIEAENVTSPGANPAGLIAVLEMKFANGSHLQITSDEKWRCSKTNSTGWEGKNFDDSSWSNAMSVTHYGGGPWGQIDGEVNDVLGPQSTGIPGVVEVVYVPRSDSIEVRELGAHESYSVNYFDPVKGTTTSGGEIESDAAGLWTCSSPAGIDHDWVVVLKLKKKDSASNPRQLTLADDELAWQFDWQDGTLRGNWFDNKLTGHRFVLSDVQELGLNFSSAIDRVATPLLRAVDFEVREAREENAEAAVFELRSRTMPIGVTVHVRLDGATRRKWVEVKNLSDHEMLLLDVNLDHFKTPGNTSGGGNGKPLFIEDEVFAAIEHPAGVNTGENGKVDLSYFPGKKIEPGETFRSHVSVISVAGKDLATAHFVSYLQAKSLRPKKDISIYTPFGINNQWGACPTLDDEETLDVLGLTKKLQGNGVHFDYFTLDTGWVDPASDLTRFRPTCFPDGPGNIIDTVQSLGMKFGLWFGTSWATQSCWDYPSAYGAATPPGLPYRQGSPLTAGGINFCFASEPYFSIFKNAVLYHVRQNKVRLLKFDGGNYYCDSTDHGHLPGKYSVDAMYENLIDVAQSARAIAPDIFIMWYWGAGSPFWALYGDMVFESGLEMEGSGTSTTPTLYYRDSVTLAQDQNAQFASTIPPIVKDSLGVWLSDSRWGNFMGKERWREGLVMDLGRGNLLFPNLWGDLYQLNEDDAAFLSRMSAIARQNEFLFMHRINILGDPAADQVYGYAYGRKDHGFIFLNNADFKSRRVELPLDKNLGLQLAPGKTLRIVSRFPEEAQLKRRDGGSFKKGDMLDIWLRPFEVLMLEVNPETKADTANIRSISDANAGRLGLALPLRTASLDPRMSVRFADATRFAGKNLKLHTEAFETTLPDLGDDPAIFAVAIRLRNGDAEWRYAPTVEEIVQPILRVDDENVQLVPVPDGRQFGNTQSFGCSWVVYKIRLAKRWSKKPLKLAIHAYLPDGVKAKPEGWVVQHWWKDETRPSADGYYTDAPQ
jgi:hypothetical protein